VSRHGEAAAHLHEARAAVLVAGTDGSAIRLEMTKSKFATQFADSLEAALGPIQEPAPS
jgi:hypothetical protein